ncbi:MAG: 4-hydroxy-tetrahydrodipicolinate synthase [Ignavibacteriales bacterium]|nr:4-hydroxy-tetrahydrodipicolinate synthase [Ignavibacteriales bacterium]
MKKKFHGTGTALVTPFKKNGALDEHALLQLLDYQLKGNVEAVVPLGTTGENPALSRTEMRRIIELAVDHVAGRALVIAGAGSNSTATAIELAREAQAAGADAVLVVGPYYNKPTQEGYFRHFRAIAEEIDIPIIVYNVPGRTGGNIEAGTILRIAEEIPLIRGVKEASGNMAQIMEIARNKSADFSLLSGDDGLTLPMMAVGGDGCISVVANEAPSLFSSMVRACLGGKWEKARDLHNRLLPLMNANFLESNPIPVKAALSMMGLIEEVYRLPLVELSARHREPLRKILKNLDLL